MDEGSGIPERVREARAGIPDRAPDDRRAHQEEDFSRRARAARENRASSHFAARGHEREAVHFAPLPHRPGSRRRLHPDDSRENTVTERTHDLAAFTGLTLYAARYPHVPPGLLVLNGYLIYKNYPVFLAIVTKLVR